MHNTVGFTPGFTHIGEHSFRSLSLLSFVSRMSKKKKKALIKPIYSTSFAQPTQHQAAEKTVNAVEHEKTKIEIK